MKQEPRSVTCANGVKPAVGSLFLINTTLNRFCSYYLASFFLRMIFLLPFFTYFCSSKMVVVAQLVRASDCGSEGRRFEPG